MRGPIDRALPWLCGCTGYFAAYFLSTAVPTPLLWHLPLEHRFAFEVGPVALGADFYGRVLLSLAAFAACALAARLFLRARAARAGTMRLWLAWSFGLAGLTACLYVYLLSGRRPIPAPLPPGYVAR